MFSVLSMPGNNHDIALNFMGIVTCHAVDKQVHDLMPSFRAGDHQINVVVIDIGGQLLYRIAFQRDDLNLASSTVLCEVIR